MLLTSKTGMRSLGHELNEDVAQLEEAEMEVTWRNTHWPRPFSLTWPLAPML